jgi:hypothetical protein
LSAGDILAPPAAGRTADKRRDIKSCARDDSSNATLSSSIYIQFKSYLPRRGNAGVAEVRGCLLDYFDQLLAGDCLVDVGLGRDIVHFYIVFGALTDVCAEFVFGDVCE